MRLNGNGGGGLVRRAASGLLAFWTMLVLAASGAYADQPHPWQLGFQRSASTVEDRIHRLNDILLVIITLITIFVMALLAYVIWRFRESKNPVPSRTSHNTVIEVLWTVLPVVILLIIAVPSFRLLFYMDKTEQAEMTLKVTGLQWYWKYEYVDAGFGFDSYMVPADKLAPGQPRLLTADNPVVLPVNTNIRIEIAGNDVMHSWFIPSLGVQKYVVPGRLNETWVNIKAPGTYYGECNQICGVNHAFMPIQIQAVSKEEYARWTAQAKTKFASNEVSPVRQTAATGAEAAPAAQGSSDLRLADLRLAAR